MFRIEWKKIETVGTITLMDEAMAFAKTFNKKRPIFGEMKKRLHGKIVEVYGKG
ncbi:MAG: hypothetical protein AABY92_08975 [Thermodesulfobacteriota bacterium]